MVSSQVSRWLNISAAFNTIDTDKLLLRLESDFGVCGLASAWIRSYITGRWCYVAIGDLRSDVWSCDSGVPQGSVLDLSSSLPSYPPSQRSWSPTESGFINSSIRGRYSTLHGDPLPGSVSNGGSLTMCLGVDVLVPRQRASIKLNQVRGHDPWLKAGSFQVGARSLVRYRRWSCGGQGRN